MTERIADDPVDVHRDRVADDLEDVHRSMPPNISN